MTNDGNGKSHHADSRIGLTERQPEKDESLAASHMVVPVMVPKQAKAHLCDVHTYRYFRITLTGERFVCNSILSMEKSFIWADDEDKPNGDGGRNPTMDFHGEKRPGYPWIEDRQSAIRIAPLIRRFASGWKSPIY